MLADNLILLRGLKGLTQEQAAEIAVRTVKSFLHQSTSVKKVIFNVFKDLDKRIYEKLLRTD